MWKGCSVALVTPMNEAGDIVWDEWYTLLDLHQQAKTDAVVVAGTTGESPTLNHREWSRLVQTAVEYPKRSFKVIAGTGSNDTHAACEYTQEAKHLGAEACLVVTPYYNRPTQTGLLHHFAKVADVGLPVILYNVPGRTACDCLPDTVIELSQHPYIQALKECTDDWARLQRYQTEAADLYLLTGNDGSTLEFMKQGGHGTISVTANLYPRIMKAFINACLNGDWLSAEHYHDALLPTHDALFIQPNPIPIKWALAKKGLISHGIRLPLTSLEEPYIDTLTRVLDSGPSHDQP